MLMNSDLRRLWSVLTPKERRTSIIMLLLVVAMAVMETLGVVSIVPFLSVLVSKEVVHENAALEWLYAWSGVKNETEFVFFLGVFSVVLVVVGSIVKTISIHFINRFSFMLRHGISDRLLSSYLWQPYGFFLLHSRAELSRNVLSEVDQLHVGLIKPLSQLVAQGGVAAAIILLLFMYNPLVAASAVLVVSTLYGLVYFFVRKRLERTGKLRQVANGGRFSSCGEALEGIKDVKITCSAEVYRQKFSRFSREYSRHQSNAETLSQSPLYFIEIAGYAGLISISLVLLSQYDDMSHVLPVLGLYGFAAYRLLPSAQIMYRGVAQLKFASATLNSIYEHLSLTPEVPLNGEPLVPRREIRLENVSFSYPANPDTLILESFNLVVPVGEIVAIVGPSGAGKSTIMDLLLGLTCPTKGVLKVDGEEIVGDKLKNWQASIGYVPQQVFIADGSVCENIAFGVRLEEIDMQAVVRAAKLAKIDSFISKELPEGYETALGDFGIRLSGGQKQRIGIARALYRDPPVVFLDEATSALDWRAEDDFYKGLRDDLVDKTIVLITHREAVVSYCSQSIFVSGRNK